MDGRQIAGNGFPNKDARLDATTIESQPSLTTGLMHPDEVVNDRRLTLAEKREVLASWASDVRVVPDAPSLRQLDNGAVVRVGDILRALQLLSDDNDFEHTACGPIRPFAELRIRLPSRLKTALRRSRSDDDDDPPPCPATIDGPRGGPLFGGEAADLGLAPAV